MQQNECRGQVVCWLMVVALTLVLVALCGPGPVLAAGSMPYSFVGVSAADLVVGVPYEAIGSEASAGAVHVLYSNVYGLTSSFNQLWYQDVADVQDSSEAGDEFGFALAVGDFDGDGLLDLAIGVHGESMGGITNTGVVQVFYGTGVFDSGLSADNDTIWYQDIPGIWELAEDNDRFGWSLAAGDFNGDGRDDLAVGVIWEDVGDPVVENAGAVNVLYGSASGLSSTNNQLWYAGHNGLLGTPEANAWFGHTLATGDLNGDGYDDLAVGVPYKDLNGAADVGCMHVIYGSTSGLTSVSNQMGYQGVNGVGDAAEAGDMFGFAMAIGDLDGNGYDDLAVGVPYEDLLKVAGPEAVDAGAVHLFFGSALGLASDRLTHQDDTGMVDEAEDGDAFGYALAIGDFDCNAHKDLAIGVPFENVGTPAIGDAGAVHIKYSWENGKNVLWHQDSTGILDIAEANDRFGSSLAAGDFDGNGFTDLAVGVPWEDLDLPSVQNGGAVNVLYGSIDGLSADGNQLWAQDCDPDIAGTAEPDDRFGLALATSKASKGIFATGFERGDAGGWSVVVP